jgi:hypothetical protein
MAALANPPYWYIGSSKWTAVTAWPTSTAKAAGTLVRQNATPTLGQERVFVCVVAGTTAGSEPTWTVTKGDKTTDNTVTWQECTGQPPVNGDATNTKDWNSASGNTVALGQIIKNVAATHYFICTTAGTAGSGAEPTWNTTAGQTTADNGVTWTSLGAVGSFGAWAGPHQRIPNAIATNWGKAGDTFYISNNHAESQASGWSTTFIGTQSSPCNYICVTDTSAPPTAVNTTASVTTTSNSGITFGGGSAAYFYMYGITFNCGTGSGGAVISIQAPSPVFDSCGFNLVNTATSNNIQLSAGTSGDRNTVCRNCTFTFSNASQTMKSQAGNAEIIGGSIAATGTAPSTLIPLGAGPGNLLVRDCDISGVTGNLVDLSAVTTASFLFANCKLGAGVTLGSSTITGAGDTTLRVHNCDSGATNYRMYTAKFAGTSQQSTSTYNNAGATDGTTRISWKIDTNTFPFFGQPFVSEQIFQWVDTTGGALTATVEIAGAASLNNDDIWMEIEYLGNASYPIGSVADCRKASILASNAAVTSSSASWSGSPAVTQKLQVTFTPQMKGPIKARIYVAKKSATIYVDPLITVA